MEKSTEKMSEVRGNGSKKKTNKTWEAFGKSKGSLIINDPENISIPSWIMERMNAAWSGHPMEVEYPKKKVSKTLEAARRLKGSLMVSDPKFLL